MSDAPPRRTRNGGRIPSLSEAKATRETADRRFARTYPTHS